MIIKGRKKATIGETVNIFTIAGKTSTDCNGLKSNEVAETGKILSIDDIRFMFIFWTFLQKFIEMTLVFYITIFGMQWEPLYETLDKNMWELVASIVLEAILLYGIRLQCNPLLYRYPGRLLVQLMNLLFMSSVYFFFGIHGSKLYLDLTPYFVTLAAAVTLMTYASYAFLAFWREMHSKGPSYWLLGVVMPIAVVVCAQPIYFYFNHDENFDKAMFMDYNINVISGVLFSLIDSYMAIYGCRKFMNSDKLIEWFKMEGCLAVSVDKISKAKKGGTEKI